MMKVQFVAILMLISCGTEILANGILGNGKSPPSISIGLYISSYQVFLVFSIKKIPGPRRPVLNGAGYISSAMRIAKTAHRDTAKHPHSSNLAVAGVFFSPVHGLVHRHLT